MRIPLLKVWINAWHYGSVRVKTDLPCGSSLPLAITFFKDLDQVFELYSQGNKPQAIRQGRRFLATGGVVAPASRIAESRERRMDA
jgi:hypothetical protein